MNEVPNGIAIFMKIVDFQSSNSVSLQMLISNSVLEIFFSIPKKYELYERVECLEVLIFNLFNLNNSLETNILSFSFQILYVYHQHEHVFKGKNLKQNIDFGELNDKLL